MQDPFFPLERVTNEIPPLLRGEKLMKHPLPFGERDRVRGKLRILHLVSCIVFFSSCSLWFRYSDFCIFQPPLFDIYFKNIICYDSYLKRRTYQIRCYHRFMRKNLSKIGKTEKTTTVLPDSQYCENGIDPSLIQWMLSLTPTERLQVLQNTIRSIIKLRGD